MKIKRHGLKIRAGGGRNLLGLILYKYNINSPRLKVADSLRLSMFV